VVAVEDTELGVQVDVGRQFSQALQRYIELFRGIVLHCHDTPGSVYFPSVKIIFIYGINEYNRISEKCAPVYGLYFNFDYFGKHVAAVVSMQVSESFARQYDHETFVCVHNHDLFRRVVRTLGRQDEYIFQGDPVVYLFRFGYQDELPIFHCDSDFVGDELYNHLGQK
jgi:hypothetical protein